MARWLVSQFKKKYYSSGSVRLASHFDWRAAEKLNYISYWVFKHSVRLTSRRAAEPLKYISYSFFKYLVRLTSRRATEPLNYISYSFFKHLVRLTSRRATEPLNYISYSFFTDADLILNYVFGIRISYCCRETVMFVRNIFLRWFPGLEKILSNRSC